MNDTEMMEKRIEAGNILGDDGEFLAFYQIKGTETDADENESIIIEFSPTMRTSVSAKIGLVARNALLRQLLANTMRLQASKLSPAAKDKE